MLFSGTEDRGLDSPELSALIVEFSMKKNEITVVVYESHGQTEDAVHKLAEASGDVGSNGLESLGSALNMLDTEQDDRPVLHQQYE
ncbi:MAG: hypothetical protein ACXW11_00840 [Methylotenera sp.]